MSHTEQLANWYGIPARTDNEDEGDFRRRVAQELRNRGKIIEAHEALTDSRYDAPTKAGEDTMTGVMGAVACVMQRVPYAGKVEDESAAGLYLRAKQENPDPPLEVLLLMMGALGKR